MSRILTKSLFFIPLLALSTFEVSSATDFRDSDVMHVDYPGWFESDPFFDLSAIVAKARTGGKHGVMVYFKTEGCSYCALFIKQSLGDPVIAKRVQDNFVSIGLEIFDDAEMTDPLGKPIRVKDFASAEKAGFSPTLVFFDTDGKRILRAVGYQSPERFNTILSYITGKYYQTQTLAQYFERVSDKTPKPTARAGLKDDTLFSKPPYALDRSRFAASQPLLVIFATPGCAECNDFHDEVLAVKEVREILKDFEVVRLDAADTRTPVVTPQGKRETPTSWYKQTGFSRVPALLFFDEKGNEVLSTDALVKRQRMLNSLSFMTERAYEKGWTYQRQARENAIKRSQQKK